MIDYGRSGRKTTYGYYLVDPLTLRETGQMVEVEQDSGSITYDYYSDNKYSASFNVAEPLGREHLIRIKQLIEVGGEQVQTTLGTFFIDDMPQSAKYGSVKRKVSGYSCLWKYTQDVLVSDHFWAKGFRCVEAIREIVEWDSGHLLIEPGVDTERGFGQPVFFKVGTNRYEAMADIASWINCEMDVNEDGYIVIRPYVNPAYIAPSYTFSVENSVYLSGIELDDMQAESKNRALVYYSNQDASDSAVADLPAEHPFSFERIGRRATYTEQVQDVMSHEELAALAQRRLDEKCAYDTYYKIENVSVPEAKYGRTVIYQNYDDYTEPIDAKCLVTQIDMELSKTARCTTKLKVV